MVGGLSLFSVQAVLILGLGDDKGTYYSMAQYPLAAANSSVADNRIFAKYYSEPHGAASGAGKSEATPSANQPYPDVKSQRSFETGLLQKTAKQTTDIILYDGRLVLFKMASCTGPGRQQCDGTDRTLTPVADGRNPT